MASAYDQRWLGPLQVLSSGNWVQKVVQRWCYSHTWYCCAVCKTVWMHFAVVKHLGQTYMVLKVEHAVSLNTHTKKKNTFTKDSARVGMSGD